MTEAAEPPPPSARGAASAMAVGTLLSRITGLLRNTALAAALGLGPLQDAFNAGYTVPSMLLVLVTGGTLSAVLVPLLTREPDLASRRRAAESIGGVIVIVTGIATVLLVAASPLVARVFALGKDGAEADAFIRAATLFLVLLSAQVVLWAVSVYANAVMQSAGRLALAGFSPILANVLSVAAVGLYVLAVRSPDGQLPGVEDVPAAGIVVLGTGMTLAIGAMAFVQLLGARRVLPGLRLRPRIRRGDPVNAELLRLGRWTLVLVAANQAGLLAVLILAASVGGGLASYQNAFIIMQLPYAIVAVSLLSALYPRLSRAAAGGVGDSARAYARTLSQGLRLGSLLMLPCAAGLFVLADPVAQLLLGYGEAAGNTGLVAAALRWFGVALLPFTLFNLLTRGHYALKETRTPALVTVVLQVVNVTAAYAAFSLAGTEPGSIAGLALGYAAGYAVGAGLLMQSLRRRRHGVYAGGGRALLKAGTAALVMALAIVLAGHLLPEAASRPGLAVRTLGLVALGGVVYLLACLALRTRELREVLSIRRR